MGNPWLGSLFRNLRLDSLFQRQPWYERYRSTMYDVHMRHDLFVSRLDKP